MKTCSFDMEKKLSVRACATFNLHASLVLLAKLNPISGEMVFAAMNEQGSERSVIANELSGNLLKVETNRPWSQFPHLWEKGSADTAG